MDKLKKNIFFVRAFGDSEREHVINTFTIKKKSGAKTMNHSNPNHSMIRRLSHIIGEAVKSELERRHQEERLYDENRDRAGSWLNDMAACDQF